MPYSPRTLFSSSCLNLMSHGNVLYVEFRNYLNKKRVFVKVRIILLFCLMKVIMIDDGAAFMLLLLIVMVIHFLFTTDIYLDGCSLKDNIHTLLSCLNSNFGKKEISLTLFCLPTLCTGINEVGVCFCTVSCV